MKIDHEALTVSELNGLIQEVLNLGFPRSVWVCGEIQGFDRNRDKRHIFFDLCDKDPQTHDITARIGLVIFSGRKTYLDEILSGAQNAFQLKDDIEVKFLCKVDFYPPHGDVRLIVESIDPVYTLGKIAQARQKLIASLKAKGILEKNKALSLPLVPLGVGLITAYDSAAYNDFLSELRMSGITFRVCHRNSLMQGKNAEPQICRAIKELNTHAELDVIVITRGGGSLAELSCFDSELLAHAVAESRLPVLSGIGHEINITITDLAAHTYQKTPTAIARFLVERVEDFLAEMEKRMTRILDLAQDRTQAQKITLRQYAFKLQEGTIHYLQEHSRQMVKFTQIVVRHPSWLLRAKSDTLRQTHDRLLKTTESRLKKAQEKMRDYERLAEMASPVRILRRGFSITRKKSGQVVRRVQDVANEKILKTQLCDGMVESRIQGTKEKRP